jgi:DNA-binding NarL/FixJ family response regulator
MREQTRAVLAARFPRCRVEEAGDGAAAVTAARRLQPLVIVMDLNMPGMGGLEATARIVAALPDASVVVYTIEGGETVRSLALKAGARAFVLKDDGVEALLGAIAAVPGCD